MAIESRMVAMTTTTISSIRVKPWGRRAACCKCMVPLDNYSTALGPADTPAHRVRGQIHAQRPALDVAAAASALDLVGLVDEERRPDAVGGYEGAAGRVGLQADGLRVGVGRIGAESRGRLARRQEHLVEGAAGHGREHV